MRSKDDVASRILRAGGNPSELYDIMQDECRRRAAKKLPATLLCPDFRFPTTLSAEQCTSDALARFHASLIPEGATVIDLTCGLAIDAFHMARKARQVTCLDIEPAVAAHAGSNARALSLANITAICSDCRQWLAENPSRRFDVAFIDPARRGHDGRRLISLTQCQPDVTTLLPAIFAVAPRIIIKASPMLDISAVAAELPGAKTIRAVGTPGECKELLIELERGHEGDIQIWADTVGQSSVQIGHTIDPIATGINVGDTIGEPCPAVMKCMPRGLGGGERLHISTMLWRNPAPDFPGRHYRVERIEPFSSSTLRRLAREKLNASVATRNFPLPADQLRQRLKATESANCRLMATTVGPTSLKLLLLLTPTPPTFPAATISEP